MTKLIGPLTTDLGGSVQDCQFNYYGSKLAVSDSEGSIEIQDLEAERDVGQKADQGYKREHFKAHDGPIWQVAWAEPGCGNLLASCSYDKTIKIWSEENCRLTNVHTINKYDCSVNCIAWVPSEYGIALVAGLSNGKVIIITYVQNEERWDQKVIEAHSSSVNAVSIYRPADKEEVKNLNIKFVSCSCDNQVYEWTQNNGDFEREKIGFHNEWVRDVSYYNSDISKSTTRVVSGGEDNLVKIWRKEQEGEWQLEKEIAKDSPVWRTEFSPVGGLLSVCSGDNQTTVYKEKIPGSGDWVQESVLNEEGVK